MARVAGIDLDGVVVHSGIKSLVLGTIGKFHPEQAYIIPETYDGCPVSAQLEVQRLKGIVRMTGNKCRRKRRDGIEVTYWSPPCAGVEVGLVAFAEVVAEADAPKRNRAIDRDISQRPTGGRPKWRDVLAHFDCFVIEAERRHNMELAKAEDVFSEDRLVVRCAVLIQPCREPGTCCGQRRGRC